MKTLIILASTLFCIIEASAQTYLYDTSQIFEENGYTYKADVPSWQLVTLRNINNIYTGVKYMYKDGSEVTDRGILNGYVTMIETDNWTNQKRSSIVNNAFSEEEKYRVQGATLGITMTVDTDTGKVIEVYFRFHRENPFATIPVSTYRRIEQELKEQIWFTLTDTGRQMKFIQRSWTQKVESSLDRLFEDRPPMPYYRQKPADGVEDPVYSH